MIREKIEGLIVRFTADGTKTFFDPARFPWTAKVEAEWTTVRRELDQILLDRASIPNFQDVAEEQKQATSGTDWKTFFFYGYGHRVDENCRRCPDTARLLNVIPGLKTAFFSILAPGKHVPEHRGPYKGVLRYHLGLIVPGPPGACRIRVGPDVREWQEGASMIFDDSHPHEVWNDAVSLRVVLFVDFIRPLPFPLSLLNRLMIWRIGTSEYVRESIRKIRKHATGASAAQ